MMSSCLYSVILPVERAVCNTEIEHAVIQLRCTAESIVTAVMDGRYVIHLLWLLMISHRIPYGRNVQPKVITGGVDINNWGKPRVTHLFNL